MARKKKHEEHENHERWLVSYADFITLLFAFFVVMYSVSSVNEGKYRVLSSTMVTAFNRPVKTLDPIQIGTTSKSMPSRIILQSSKPVMMEIPGIPGTRGGRKEKGEGGKSEQEKEQEKAIKEKAKKDSEDSRTKLGLRSSGVVMRKIGEDLEKALSSLIDQGLVSINKDSQRVEVQIKSSVLYQSGSATISLDAIPVLEKIGKILSPFPNEVMVEGYTDNIPISNMIYPSNWELSAARSASVVHLFMKSGIDPKRMTAMGYAEFRPIADNKTEEGRSINRRVVLVIPAELEAKAIVESLKGSGIGIGGRKSEDASDKKKAEESLISNIKLKRDSLPGMDLSTSEIIESIKIKSNAAGAELSGTELSKEAGADTGKAVDNILEEKPGVFPVKLIPFQLPELPVIKNMADKDQAQKDQIEVEKGKPEDTPSLKGKVKTIYRSDEKQIQEDREVKLNRTTDVGHEAGLQSVIIKKSTESEVKPDGKQGTQMDNGSAGRKGAFPIIRLPAITDPNGGATKSIDSSKSGDTQGNQARPPEGEGGEVRPEIDRKVILNRNTAPSYESKPQAVPSPQSNPESQQSSDENNANIKKNKPVKSQLEQGSAPEGQSPRFIAPPIRLPFGNIGSPGTSDADSSGVTNPDVTNPDVTNPDVTNNTQPSGDQP